MTESPGASGTADDAFAAIHEAGHCVAMHRWGFGVDLSTIVPASGRAGFTRQRVAADEAVLIRNLAYRQRVEFSVMVILAGAVAEQIYRPRTRTTLGIHEHEEVHAAILDVAERDESVATTWCDYLWQRTYAALAEPQNWVAVKAVAHALEIWKTLQAAHVEALIDATDRSFRETLPNMRVAEGPRGVITMCSPWHRWWHRRAGNLAEGRDDASANVELVRRSGRPVNEVLRLSVRSRNCLANAGIKTIEELEAFSPQALLGFKNMGTKTVAEIAAAMSDAGFSLASRSTPESEEGRHE